MSLVGVFAVTFVVVLVLAYLILLGILRNSDKVFCAVCQLQMPRHKTMLHKGMGRVCKTCAFALSTGALARCWRL